MKKVFMFMGVVILVMGMISCDKKSNDIDSDNDGVLIGNIVYDTIQDAIDAAVDGDTLLLTQGIYAGDNNTNLMWEGDEKHLTIMTDLRGHQLDYAIIEGNGKGAGFYFGNSHQSQADVIYGITIRNMGSEAEHFNAAFYCENAEPLIQYCYVYDCNWTGVYCYNADPHFENSQFFDNKVAFLIDYESNPVLLNNFIETSELDGVYAIGDSYPAVYNNLIMNNERGGVYLLQARALMVNNTIVNNDQWGVKIRSDELSQMVNCIVWNNVSEFDVIESGILIASYTCAPTENPDVNPDSLNNIYSDPQFVSAIDFQLQATSPCLDIGNTGAVGWQDDLNGNPRVLNTTVDLGAYERQ